MKSFKEDRIEIGSHLYFHCSSCNGIYQYDEYSNNTVFTLTCPYCNYRRHIHCSNREINDKLTIKLNSNIGEFESTNVISRLVNIVSKEGALQHFLKIVHKHTNGIDRKELERIITSCGYRQKIIDQAFYFGLVSQSQEDDKNNISFCHLTEKGLIVLKACKNLNSCK